MSDLPDGFGPDDPTAREHTESKYVPADFKLTAHSPSNPPTAEPWLMIELDEPGTVGLGLPDGFLGLECRPGVTMEEASQLRKDLHRLISDVSFTRWLT